MTRGRPQPGGRLASHMETPCDEHAAGQDRAADVDADRAGARREGAAARAEAPAACRSRLADRRSAIVAARVVPPLVVHRARPCWSGSCCAARPARRCRRRRKVCNDTWELIVDPFFDRGGLDKGLFWHLLGEPAARGARLRARLPRRRRARHAGRPVDLGDARARSDLPGAAHGPPLAWLPLSLAAFRDGQPSAIFVIFITAIWPIIINTAVGIRNIPQDYRNVAQVLRLNHLEFFWKIMMPSAAPYIFTGPAHRHRPVLARDRRGRDADRRRRHRLLHLGRVELVAHQRDHPGAGLCRPDRLRARPHRRRASPPSSPAAPPPTRTEANGDDALSQARPHRQDLPPRLGRDRGAQGHHARRSRRASSSRSSAIPAAARPRCSTSSPAWCRRHRLRAAGGPRGQRARPRPRGRVPEPLAAAVAHGLRQRAAGGRQGVLPAGSRAPSATTGCCTISSSCRWRTPRTSGRRRSPAA